ncbi:MAG: zinc ribbon domain-containing protein [Desulfobacterales bacterium]|nr:zinc ribbon domain-containing protein [Desulfobacterales bacterium]
MPIYEFKCNKCGKIFEQLVFASDGEEGILCPSCGKTDTCRLLSSFSCGSSIAGSVSSSGCAPSTGGFS